MSDGKGEIWFVRNVPRALRQQVADAAKTRRQPVGELVTAMLTDWLARLEAGVAVGASVAVGRDCLAELDRLSERVTALEAHRARGGQSGGRPAGKVAGPHQRRSERQERPVAVDGALFVGEGGGRRLTAVGEAEVIRRHVAGESMKAVGRALGISDRTVAAVIARSTTGQKPEHE